MSNPTKRRRSRKPRFPLWEHKGSARWCKKVGKRFYYFQPVADDPTGEASLDEWTRLKDALGEGRELPSIGAGDGTTVKELLNAWGRSKDDLLESGELAQRTHAAYKATARFVLDALGQKTVVKGLGPADFAKLRRTMTKRWGPVRLRNEMAVVESIFKYGLEAELFDRLPNYGPDWRKPKAKVLRAQKDKRGDRTFSSDELRSLLDHAGPNMRTMLLLGVQAGMGNTDLGLLPVKVAEKAVETGWLDYPRPKTSIRRHIPLWPETIDALREVLTARRTPKDPADSLLLFIGPRGESYVGNHRGYRVSQEFDRTAARAGVTGHSFYDCRRTFQTIGEDSEDLVAVQALMGHAAASGDMSAVYRQRVSDTRLEAVVQVVHSWLWPVAGPKPEIEEMDSRRLRIVG